MTRALPVQISAYAGTTVATAAEALAAFAALGWTDAEIEDAECGLWLVQTDAAFRRTLRRSGFATRTVGDVEICAEMA